MLAGRALVGHGLGPSHGLARSLQKGSKTVKPARICCSTQPNIPVFGTSVQPRIRRLLPDNAAHRIRRYDTPSPSLAIVYARMRPAPSKGYGRFSLQAFSTSTRVHRAPDDAAAHTRVGAQATPAPSPPQPPSPGTRGTSDKDSSLVAPSSDTQNASSSSSSTIGQYTPEKLSEDIMTLPNILTIIRLASTPVLGYLIIAGEMRYALALLAAAGFTDVLDGWLARRYGSATVFGSIADPAADKALMTVMVGALAWRGLIPIPLVVLIIGRDIALILSAFLIRWRSLPAPKTFARYFNPRLPSAKVMPTQVSKYNTLLQIILVGVCTLLASLSEANRQWWAEREGLWSETAARQEGNVEGNSSSPSSSGQDPRNRWGDVAKKAWHAFMLLVSATTIWSGASYLSGSGAVNVVSKGIRTATVRRTGKPRGPGQ